MDDCSHPGMRPPSAPNDHVGVAMQFGSTLPRRRFLRGEPSTGRSGAQTGTANFKRRLRGSPECGIPRRNELGRRPNSLIIWRAMSRTTDRDIALTGAASCQRKVVGWSRVENRRSTADANQQTAKRAHSWLPEFSGPCELHSHAISNSTGGQCSFALFVKQHSSALLICTHTQLLARSHL